MPQRMILFYFLALLISCSKGTADAPAPESELEAIESVGSACAQVKVYFTRSYMSPEDVVVLSEGNPIVIRHPLDADHPLNTKIIDCYGDLGFDLRVVPNAHLYMVNEDSASAVTR